IHARRGYRHDRWAPAPGHARARRPALSGIAENAEAVSALALGLVLLSAFVHASWNFLLKKSGGGTGLITAASLLSLLVYAPIVAVATWIQGYHFHPLHLALMLGSGMIHTAYFILLDRAYRSGGDLSIVYPLARATGPLITIVVAVLVLGEHPGPTALVGAILI